MLFMHTSLNFLESCSSIAAQNSIAASNVAKIWIWEGLVLKILYSLLPNPLHIKKLLEKSSNHISFGPTKKKEDPIASKLWVFKRILRIWSPICFFFLSKATRRGFDVSDFRFHFRSSQRASMALGAFPLSSPQKNEVKQLGKKSTKRTQVFTSHCFPENKEVPYENLWPWLGYVTGMVFSLSIVGNMNKKCCFLIIAYLKHTLQNTPKT